MIIILMEKSKQIEDADKAKGIKYPSLILFFVFLLI